MLTCEAMTDFGKQDRRVAYSCKPVYQTPPGASQQTGNRDHYDGKMLRCGGCHVSANGQTDSYHDSIVEFRDSRYFDQKPHWVEDRQPEPLSQLLYVASQFY